MKQKKYYEILGVSKNATLAEIKTAYRKLILEWHPDKKNNSKESIEKTQKLNEAFEVLYNGTVNKKGFDYSQEVPVEESELAVAKPLDGMYWVYTKLHNFYIGNEKDMVSDYYLIRAKRMLQAANVYKKIYKGDSGKFNMEVAMKLNNGFGWWSGQSSWDTNVNQFKKLLNHAQKALELPETTDQDLQIESKSPNKEPQIPDKGQKPIKDGVVNIEKYNKSFQKEHNETVRKYWKLRNEIYNEWEDTNRFQNANANLFNQVDNKSKEIEAQNFQTIWTTDGEDKVKEVKASNQVILNKMGEAINLMETLIAEGKNSGNKGQNNNISASEPESKKRKAEIEARQDKDKQSKTIASELEKLISEAEGINTSYPELEAKIKKIDEYQGEVEYNSRRGKIDQLKIKLGNLDSNKFKAGVIEKIKNEMKTNGIKESDLDVENELAEIKNESDIDKINKIESKVSEKIGQQGALNSLSKLLEQAKNLVKSTAKTTTEELLKQVDKIKKDLYNFQFSTNNWKTNAYQKQESAVKSVLNQLENLSTQTTQKPKSVFSRPEIMIPVALVAVLAIGGVSLLIAKKRKQAKVKVV